MTIGKVYLVGAGPGDPELLTLKGQRLLQKCDVVVVDHLVNPEILEHVRPEAEIIFIGRPRHPGRLTQAQVDSLIIARAREGKRVVRLKGGDPFIFGRGGEEAVALTRAGVPWEVVPGVSAGHAVPASAGIPLTHRQYASSVAFVTGHECVQKANAVQWSGLAKTVDTLVIFMGLKNLPRIISQLLAGGLDPETPAAIIESGTLPCQRVVTGPLDALATLAADHAIRSPALVVIGQVVECHSLLKLHSQTVQMSLSTETSEDDVFSRFP